MLTRRRTSCWALVRRNRGCLFILSVLFAFIQLGLYNGRYNQRNSGNGGFGSGAFHRAWMSKPRNLLAFGDATKSAIAEHPIPRLMEEAEEKFRKKLASQSTTLKTAVTEYQRRYGRPPPKGFDAWWDYTQAHDVKMIDEYDALFEDLQPFWEISGEEFRRRVARAGEIPSVDIVRIQDGVSEVINLNPDFHDVEGSERAIGFKEMMRKFVHLIPDMDLPINAKAEGRVLVPWELRTYPNITNQDSFDNKPFDPDWGDDGSVWEAWRRTCPPYSPARRVLSSIRAPFNNKPKNRLGSRDLQQELDFTFAKSTSSKQDSCETPHAHNTQGHFFSDWRSIPVLYPILSPARAKGFLDIRIPSHYYYGTTDRYTYGWDKINMELKDIDPMEVPWKDKIDKIFWRGATTGGGNHPPGFEPFYQRHRFVRMTSDKSKSTRPITFADPPSSVTHWSVAEVPLSALNEEIMDAAFVKAVSDLSYPGGHAALKADHRFSDAVPLGRHWSYKYLVDLDGMGYSGRFMAFLASDSVPIKATVYDEFFTDWIQPWLHYIPLSSSYREIYNIHAYFAGATLATLEAANSTSAALAVEERKSEEGDKRAQRIARAGRKWKRTIGRKLDMETYVFRLCLEWARLLADDRDSMNFSL